MSGNGANIIADGIRVSDDGHVRTIALNRPEKKNALTDRMAWRIVAAIDEAVAIDDIWVIAITGSGDSFCAGIDLTQAERFSPLSSQAAMLDDLSWVGQYLLAIRRRCDKPVVAGINGAAVGAGLGLAMAADLRIVSRKAKLIGGYTAIGSSPDAGLTITLPQAMGYEAAFRFLLENRTIKGDEAVALGMAGEVVEEDELADRLAAYCQELCRWSPIALRLLKRGMTKALETTDFEQHLRYEVANIRTAFSSADAKEAQAAFQEKRKPVFTGR